MPFEAVKTCKIMSFLLRTPYVFFSRRVFFNLVRSNLFLRTEAVSSLKRAPSQREREQIYAWDEKFMQKAFDFFMQIIQRLFKPELWWQKQGSEKERKKKSFKIYASKDYTNKEVGIKTLKQNAFELVWNKKKLRKFLEQELVIN